MAEQGEKGPRPKTILDLWINGDIAGQSRQPPTPPKQAEEAGGQETGQEAETPAGSGPGPTKTGPVREEDEDEGPVQEREGPVCEEERPVHEERRGDTDMEQTQL